MLLVLIRVGMVFISTRDQDKPFSLACFSYRSISIWYIYLRPPVFPLLKARSFLVAFGINITRKRKKKKTNQLN